jgi:protein-S-isoprenylcysteine O-methyltransferase Ste14
VAAPDIEGASVNTARYILAVALMVGLPPGLAYWFVVHPLARFWRRVGVVWTYMALTILMVPSMIGLFLMRDLLLAADFGTNWYTIALAVPCLVGGGVMAAKRRRYLTGKILAGVPEVSATRPGKVLDQGPYSIIRHPRYVETVLIVLAYALFANYVGTYVLFILTIPTLYFIVILEERELLARFGAVYADYCQRVPRFIPRRRS